jgi:Ricin-type beta-trefoil lectin domain-like/Domain of unknown function (DUF4832)/Beta-galactosidase
MSTTLLPPEKKLYVNHSFFKGFLCYKTVRRSVILRLACLLALLLGASPAFAQTPQSVNLKPLWDSVKVLENPHKGWYHHYFDNDITLYKTKKDSDLDNFPGMNHLYLRLAWSYLEPSEGNFNWQAIDTVINKWVAKGYTISFRVTCMETSITYATPEWVKNAGVPGAFYDNWGTTNWEPDYGNALFLEKLENFHRAFAARYNGAAWLEYVDVGSFGNWGEGHTFYSSNRDWPVDVLKKHLDLHKKYYTVPVYVTDDFALGRNTNDGSVQELESYILGLGFLWRDDSMLVKWYADTYPSTYSIKYPRIFEEAWATKPTLLEAQHYRIQKEEGIWQGTDGSTKGGDMMLGALRLTHASYIGFHGYADQWLAENPNLAKKIANLAGYWYFPSAAELPASAASGATSTLKMTWENHGVAPAYHNYKLKLKLDGPNGTVYTQTLTEANNKQWMPGSNSTETYSLQLPATVAAGTYTVRLGLVEERNNTTTPIKLALKDEVLGADGFYRIGSLSVVAGTTAATLPNGTYRLLARHSGKALDISGGPSATADGVLAHQWTYGGGNNQQWRIEATSNGNYKLTAQHSGKALDVDQGGITANGTKVQQWTYGGGNNQQWRIEATSGGYYKLLNVASGKALDVAGGPSATADGTKVQQWTYSGGNNQQWRIEAVTASRTAEAAAAVQAAPESSSKSSFYVYPNPSSGNASVAFSAATAQRATVYIHDQQGNLISLLTIPVQAGQTRFALPVTLPKGRYYLRTTLDGQPQRFTAEVE